MSDEKAPFNMAINTLERLSDLLREIDKLEQTFLLELAIRQEQKVYLVRQFFIQAIPLLTPGQRDDLRKVYKEIAPNFVEKFENTGWNSTKKKGKVAVYSPELDHKMNDFLMDVQIALQDEKYFMPPRRDRGKAVSEF